MEVLYHIRPYFGGYIPLHSPYIDLIYGRYLQFRFLKWPLIEQCTEHVMLSCGYHNNTVEVQSDQYLLQVIHRDMSGIPWLRAKFVGQEYATGYG